MIKTDRLSLRIAIPDDAKLAAQFHLDNAAHVRRWSPARTEEFYTEEYWRERLTEAQKGGSYRFWAFLDDALAASVILRDVRYGPNQCAEIGYTVDHRFVGQRVATEAAGAVVAYAFDELRLHRIEATYMPTNLASARVLEKLGFVREGVLRDMLFINGRWEDYVIASLLHSEVHANA